MLKQKAVVVTGSTSGIGLGMARAFAAQGNVSACGLAALAGQRFELVINATSAGLSGATPDLPEGLVRDALAYDMVYGADTTPFVRWSRAHGARTALDGLGMLVEQAAESFFIWRGVRPATAPVLAELRA